MKRPSQRIANVNSALSKTRHVRLNRANALLDPIIEAYLNDALTQSQLHVVFSPSLNPEEKFARQQEALTALTQAQIQENPSVNPTEQTSSVMLFTSRPVLKFNHGIGVLYESITSTLPSATATPAIYRALVKTLSQTRVLIIGGLYDITQCPACLEAPFIRSSPSYWTTKKKTSGQKSRKQPSQKSTKKAEIIEEISNAETLVANEVEDVIEELERELEEETLTKENMKATDEKSGLLTDNNQPSQVSIPQSIQASSTEENTLRNGETLELISEEHSDDNLDEEHPDDSLDENLDDIVDLEDNELPIFTSHDGTLTEIIVQDHFRQFHGILDENDDSQDDAEDIDDDDNAENSISVNAQFQKPSKSNDEKQDQPDQIEEQSKQNKLQKPKDQPKDKLSNEMNDKADATNDEPKKTSKTQNTAKKKKNSASPSRGMSGYQKSKRQRGSFSFESNKRGAIPAGYASRGQNKDPLGRNLEFVYLNSSGGEDLVRQQAQAVAFLLNRVSKNRKIRPDREAIVPVV